jgi:hypothetical protein
MIQSNLNVVKIENPEVKTPLQRVQDLAHRKVDFPLLNEMRSLLTDLDREWTLQKDYVSRAKTSEEKMCAAVWAENLTMACERLQNWIEMTERYSK